MTTEYINQYVESVNYAQIWKRRIAMALPMLSVFVVIIVFWWLKLTGITLAGEAFCGYTEHVHTQECTEQVLICDEITDSMLDLTDNQTVHQHSEECYSLNYLCGYQEHVHTADCYSDITADLETPEIWEATLPTLHPDLSVPQHIVAVAQSQIGYTESSLNFTVDIDGIRHGYTRYGEWYGNPYGDWANMFTAFCLRYGGLTSVPINSGADVMKTQWTELGLYKPSGEYSPVIGDVVFFDKNGNGNAEITAIVEQILENGTFIVIEGDVEGQVTRWLYEPTDTRIMGYGLTDPSYSVIITPSQETEAQPPQETTPSEDATSPEQEMQQATPPEVFAVSPTGNILAKTTTYDASMFTSSNYFVLYTESGGAYYALDGYGNAVQIFIEDDGTIWAETANPDLFLWTFTRSGTGTSYYVQNLSTKQYIYPSTANNGAVVTSSRTASTLAVSGTNVRIYSDTTYATIDTDQGKYLGVRNSNGAAYFQFGVISKCVVWLDGTNGGMKQYSGSPDQSFTVSVGDTVTLPTEWQSPTKYAHRLRGWYDVTNNVYYPPGAEITVTGNTVLYADWIAASYDLGVFNAQASNTVSLNHIITTHVFDYNGLFNILSQRATVTVDANGHSESWSYVSSGTVPFQDRETLKFAFADQENGSTVANASGRDSNNSYNANVPVKPGILTEELIDALFRTDNCYDPLTGEGIPGKIYLGTGDYLFQIMEDPDSEYYGYYYYDSSLHAASYNQSEQRFYVYDYLERSSASASASGTDKYSDFLPLNSPYANTNGNSVDTYTYSGDLGEYDGVTHYEYDMSYTENGTVNTNMFFGTVMEVKFHLSNAPGTVDETGDYGNKDLLGNYMVYNFMGDDDVWVMVDGELVLDIGGIHGAVPGVINFSSGITTVNGQQTGTLYHLEPGDHVMTVYYLERGSSQSNCAMYFNLAPRFSLTLGKEDVLTQEALDGAEFTVYRDEECTVPAELWNSEAEYQANLPSTNVFRVNDGYAYMWGLSPSVTYYLKETKGPDNPGYNTPNGIICLTFDIKGQATFNIEIIPEAGHDSISPGFTAYGYLVDTENHAAYITITNAQDWVTDITTVQANKVWNDSINHSSDYVKVYLTVKEDDGTTRRIREAVLGEENKWSYIWTNLPEYAADGVTPINYGIEESYFTGYASEVEKVDKIVIGGTTLEESYTFENGEKYILKTANGYLSSTSATAQRLTWITEEEAVAAYDDPNSLSTWTATVTKSGSTTYVKLSNGAGQILTFNYGNNNNNRYFRLTTSSSNYQSLIMREVSGQGIRLAYPYRQGNRTTNYYVTLNLNTNGYLHSTNTESSGGIFNPMILIDTSQTVEVEGHAFTVTNTPIEQETSVKVTKLWDTGMAVNVGYETSQVPVRLYADGKDTGRTVTLSLKNGWTATFMGLPYATEDGQVITYTVEEVWDNENWDHYYGEMITVGSGDNVTYETTITNRYRWGNGIELPSVGGHGRLPWILCGLTMMFGSLIYGLVLKRKEERRHQRQ